jgi:hypothetical protein
MGLRIKNEFGITETVVLKTDPDQVMRIVTAIIITQGTLMYSLAYDSETSTHYGFEIAPYDSLIKPDNSAEDADSD